MIKQFSFFSLILLISCQPELIEDFNSIPVNHNGDIESIRFLSEDLVYLTGGEDWYLGFAGVSTDGGQTWSIDSITDKKMFALDVREGNAAAVSGIDGKYFYFQNGDWISERTTEWGMVRDLVLLDDGSSITVGGQAYRKGFINKIDADYNASRLYSEDIEFNAIAKVSENILLAAAYGVILRSTNGGEQWSYTNGLGDFFKDLLVVDSENIFAVGSNGLILKSQDAGLTWSTSKKLGDFERSDRLADIAQIDASTLWVVGKSGLILISNDLGDSWEEKHIDTDSDLKGIAANADRILIGGNEGFFISINK